MEKSELELELKQLENTYEADKLAIYRKYARANNPYKIGDTVTDHIGSLVIEKMGITVSYSEPSMVYYGIELKKDGTPVKKQTGRGVYQTNLKSI